jgi:hypothetical protein
MDRRDFLKIGGVLGAAAMLVGAGSLLEIEAKSVEAELHGKFYRGTSDGKIYVSGDAGKTWKLHTQFGTHLSVSHLYADLHQRLVTVLDCQGYDFRLALLPDARTWRTI